MENKNYQKTIWVNAPAEKSLRKINEVSWWIKNFTGSAEKLNNNFTVPLGVHNGEASFADFKVSELKPGKKVVWKVTDCYLPWFKDKKEWNNTEVAFELKEENGKTKIDVTHIGLNPQIECYEMCEKGWNGHINDLEKYINRNSEA